eukprot:6802767-Alexandrium_andersonii.AAC.1
MDALGTMMHGATASERGPDVDPLSGHTMTGMRGSCRQRYGLWKPCFAQRMPRNRRPQLQRASAKWTPPDHRPTAVRR